MKFLSGTTLVLVLHLGLFVPNTASAASQQADHALPPSTVVWKSAKAEHVYGFPELKAHKKGTLSISHDAITFTDKAGTNSIDRADVTSVSSGNQKVEIWGIKGQILRAMMPNGSGVAGAMFMHHRVDMLTIEYRDKRGAIHGAVFFLPAHQADQALQSFTAMPPLSVPQGPVESPSRPELAAAPDCQNSLDPRSVFVAAPNWDNTEVPAAYRALVYEHVIDRLRLTKGAGHIYRDDMTHGASFCPQYTIHISIIAFKPGSQVKRAIFGPVGFFVGTTQMSFDTTLTDASGAVNLHTQVKAKARGETESTNVANGVAKSIAKQYAVLLKNGNAGRSPQPTLVNRQ